MSARTGRAWLLIAPRRRFAAALSVAARGRFAAALVFALGCLCACGGDDGTDHAGGDGNSGKKAGAAAQTGTGGAGAVQAGSAGVGASGSSAPEPGGCTGGRGARALRRLTRFEYDNSVQDLLGLSAHAAERFAADTVVNGFDNNVGALVVSPLLAQQLYETSAQLAADAVKDLNKLVPCSSAKSDDACAQQFIADFGKRAFRRPLSSDESARYLDLHTTGSADGGFSAGIELVLTAMLQAPNFLYRAEIGQEDKDGRAVLDAYELATELAYTLTASTPDAELLKAADDGALGTPAQVEMQATRLIDSPRGKQQLEHFVRAWLDLERLASVPKDAQLFPEFNNDIRAAMADEVDHFVSHVVFTGDGTLRSLLDTPKVFVNDALAKFYGIALPSDLDADGFGAVDAPDPERRGLLALGAVMTTYARPDSSSPVHRGKLVRERLLCQPMQPPPPGIVVQPPPVDPTRSVRERYAMHATQEPCHTCHQLMDPIGFGFENYDGVGRYRERESDHDVDASGEIMSSVETDLTFDGVSELAQALAQSPEVERCFATEWFRFAYGLSESSEQQCGLDAMQKSFAASGGSIRDLLLSTTRSEHFLARTGGAEPPLEDVPVTNIPPGVDAGTAQPPSGVTVEPRTDSSWATGQCSSVTVTNNSDAPVEWSVPITLLGTLTNHWNANVTGDSGDVTFTGVDFNHTIAPGANAQFGYCTATM